MYGDSSYFDILSASFSKSFLTSLLILSMIFFNALVQSGNHPGVLVSADSSFNIVAISAKCLPVMYTNARSICCCNGLMSECLRQFNRVGPDKGWKEGQVTLNMWRKTCSASCFLLSPMDMIKIRADCKYDEDELAAILPYWSSFISGTIAEQITILKRESSPQCSTTGWV